jgi:hypothetical protein
MGGKAHWVLGNLNHYLTRDDKISEKKFVKYAVLYVGAGGQKHVF